MKDFVEEYYRLLTEDYSGINLTRIVDFEEFKLKQIEDSIQPQLQSEVFDMAIKAMGTHIDVGFGGGFPLLPLAKTNPDVQFYGVETRGKKAKVVNEIAEKLELANVKCFHSRIENLEIDLPATMTFKAVGKVNDFLSKVNPIEDVRVFFYKGPNFYEIESEQLKLAKKEWELIEEKEIELQGVEKRYLIGFKNKNVLRGTENKKPKNLVKLSELI